MTKQSKQKNRALISEEILLITTYASLTSAYCRAENIGIKAVVIAELKLRDVQRHVFGAHFVERADYAVLEDRPEAFNRIVVNSAPVKSEVMGRLAQHLDRLPCALYRLEFKKPA
jgi:hypothetical protein